MSLREREWSAPTLVEEWRFLASSRECQLATAKGHWSNADVWISGPASWATRATGVVVRLYALNRNARVMVGQANLAFTPFTGGLGTRSWLCISVRGHPCDGFEITAQAPMPVEAAKAVLECWGTESTPEVTGEVMDDPAGQILRGLARAPARRQAHVMLWDDLNNVHQLWRGDAIGRGRVLSRPESMEAGFTQELGNVVDCFPGAGVVRWIHVGPLNADVFENRWLLAYDVATIPGVGDKGAFYRANVASLIGSERGAHKGEVSFPGDGWPVINGLALCLSIDPSAFQPPTLEEAFFSWIGGPNV